MTDLKELIKQLSYEMELEKPLAAEMSGVYTLPLNEGLHVIVSSDEHGLTFYSELGECPKVKKEEFFLEMMDANLFGQGTTNAILGLSKNGEKIILTQHITYEMEYKEFSEILEDFINTIDYWIDESIQYK